MADYPQGVDMAAAIAAGFVLDRREAVPALIGRHEDFLYVTGLAGTARDIAALTRDGAHIYTMAGAMGGACMIGLGLALARPDRRVLVATGDGELLMNVGALATIAVLNPPNLAILCVDNGHYGETGYQKSHTSLGVDLEKIAAGSGIKRTRTIADTADLADGPRLLREGNGTAFVVLKVRPDDPPPYKRNMDPAACRIRFRTALLGPGVSPARAAPELAKPAVPDLAGYVGDIPYVAGFKPMLAPAWLDLVALIGGVEPPARTGGFAWCDLGCGQGVTASVLAATHPLGEFHGIDAMPVHIEHAAGLAREAGAGNARFHAADFATALGLGLPPLDYIVAHGVYTWVDQATRAQLRRFIDRRLAPGGLVYVSYNALPGWTADLPFQYLARALAAAASGDSAARFAAASRLIQRLAASGAASLASSYIVRELRERPQDYPPGYLVHEFLHAGWQPLDVTELRYDMAEIGLRPVGSASLVENFDRWVLGRRARRIVATIADPDQRELVRDYFLDQRFRCDVFTRDAAPLDAAAQRRRLLAAGLALARRPGAIAYRSPTPAGHLDYDNPVARSIVGALAGGARCLADLPPRGAAPRDLVGNMLALCAAGDVRPAETGRAPVDALNRALRRRLGGDETPLLALPCGTALELDRGLLALLGDGDPAWREFLALHGV